MFSNNNRNLSEYEKSYFICSSAFVTSQRITTQQLTLSLHVSGLDKPIARRGFAGSLLFIASSLWLHWSLKSVSNNMTLDMNYSDKARHFEPKANQKYKFGLEPDGCFFSLVRIFIKLSNLLDLNEEDLGKFFTVEHIGENS